MVKASLFILSVRIEVDPQADRVSSKVARDASTEGPSSEAMVFAGGVTAPLATQGNRATGLPQNTQCSHQTKRVRISLTEGLLESIARVMKRTPMQRLNLCQA